MVHAEIRGNIPNSFGEGLCWFCPYSSWAVDQLYWTLGKWGCWRWKAIFTRSDFRCLPPLYRTRKELGSSRGQCWGHKPGFHSESPSREVSVPIGTLWWPRLIQYECEHPLQQPTLWLPFKPCKQQHTGGDLDNVLELLWGHCSYPREYLWHLPAYVLR